MVRGKKETSKNGFFLVEVGKEMMRAGGRAGGCGEERGDCRWLNGR